MLTKEAKIKFLEYIQVENLQMMHVLKWKITIKNTVVILVLLKNIWMEYFKF